MKIFIFISIILQSLCSWGQTDILNFSLRENNKLIIVGEPHYIIEKDSLKLEIVKEAIKKTDKSINILLESPQSAQFFIDRFYNENDTSLLLEYLLNSQNKKTDSISNQLKSLYQFIADIKKLDGGKRKINIQCIDRELKLRPLLYTLNVLLKTKNIKNPEYLYLSGYLKEKLQQEFLSNEDYDVFRRDYLTDFKDYFSNGAEPDHLLATKLLENTFVLSSFSQQRDSLLFKNVVSCTSDTVCNIVFIGAAHVNKCYYNKEKIAGNRISLAFLLENSKESPFKRNVFSIIIFAQKVATANKTFDYSDLIYMFTDAERKTIIKPTDRNITKVYTAGQKFKYASKAYDVAIVIREAKSNL